MILKIPEEDLIGAVSEQVTAADLTERFDCDAEAIDLAMAPLVQAGKVRAVSITGPFGVVGGYVAIPPPLSPPASPVRRIARGQRVQMAVSFLRAHPDNRATEDEMRQALGLHPMDPPFSWLASGVHDGRLAFCGRFWTLGPRSQPKIDSANVADKLLARAAAALRCGRFSDGTVEIQRGGKVIAVLTKDEADILAEFLREA